MQVQATSHSNSFHGKFKVNPIFEKYKEGLEPKQKDIFNRFIKRIEKVKDGRVFKFDKFNNPNEAGGAEVGIFEQKALINGTYWISLFSSTREKADWCFEQFHNMYKNI